MHICILILCAMEQTIHLCICNKLDTDVIQQCFCRKNVSPCLFFLSSFYDILYDTEITSTNLILSMDFTDITIPNQELSTVITPAITLIKKNLLLIVY